MRIANKERADLLFHTEVNHSPSGLMTQIANTMPSPATLFVLGALQLLPSPRVFLTPCLLSCQLPKLLLALSLERPDTASCYHDRLACIGGDRRQMNLTQVDRRVNGPKGSFSWWHLNTDMEFIAIVPHECTGCALFGQIKGQDKRRATFAHWQDHSPGFA